MWANEGGGIPPLAMLSYNDVANYGTAKNPNLGRMKLIQMKSITALFEQYARIKGLYIKTGRTEL